MHTSELSDDCPLNLRDVYLCKMIVQSFGSMSARNVAAIYNR